MDIERFQRAVALLDAGKAEDALQEFEALAVETSDTQEKGSLVLNQVPCFWSLGRLKEARERLSEAQRLWSNLYADFLDARLCVWENRKDEALSKLTLFLESHPDLKQSDDQNLYVDALEELGRLFVDLGRSEEAVVPLEGALKLAQGDQRRRILHYLGVCDVDKENWEVAEKRFVQSLAADPQGFLWPQAQYYLGICHFETGNLRLAEQELSRALPADYRDPLWAQVQYQLGRVYYHQGAYVSAKKAFELSDCFSEGSAVKTDLAKWLAAVRFQLGERSDSIASRQ